MASDINNDDTTGSNASPGSPQYPTSSGTPRYSSSSTTIGAIDKDENRLLDAAQREASSAKQEALAAAGTVKETAAGLASAAKARMSEGVDAGKEQVTSSIGDFAAAIRKASDELGERDQSMAANMVREVANGLEQASSSIQGSSVQDITRSVADFARRQPTAFLIGAALAGVALGRFARATGEHADRGSYDGQGSDADRNRSFAQGRSYVGEASGVSHRGPAGDYKTSYVNQPSPTEGAYPTGEREPLTSPTGAMLGAGSGSFNPVGDDNVR